MTTEWAKSSYSSTGGQCVEARVAAAGADIRDTQNRDAGHLSFPASEWLSLVRGAQKRGSSV